MDDHTLNSIRRIFLNPRPNIAYITAAGLLGMSFSQLKNEIAEGTIVAVSTGIGMRVAKEEMIATAMRTWPQAVIEEARNGASWNAPVRTPSGTTRRGCSPRPSGWWSCGPGFRGIRRRCCNGWRGGMRPPSTRCLRASWRTWPARTPRSWLRRFRDSGRRWFGRRGRREQSSLTGRRQSAGLSVTE